LTNQYRILISYESEGQRLDIYRLRTKMKDERMSNLRIEEKPVIGKTYTVEIYYEDDIPVSKAVAAQLMLGQNFVVKVLQEVQDKNGRWLNVDKTLATICQDENCKNAPEMTAMVKKKDGKKKMYLICKHHANLLSTGINFNIMDENN
jgi:hypothetical protein